MTVIYKPQFLKDVEALPKKVRANIKAYLILIETAVALREIPKLKKLEGAENLYRIAVNYRYRLLLHWSRDTQSITMLAAVSREDAYKK